MPNWEAGVISKKAKYRNTSAGSSGGVWNLNDQLRHKHAANWMEPFAGWPGDYGERVPATITTGTINDTTEDFNVYHEDMENAVQSVGFTGRLYLAVKVTASTAYFNDFCLGAVQITNSNYSTLDFGWSFGHTADYTSWEKPQVHNIGVASPGYENYSDISSAGSQAWSALTTSNGNYKIVRGTSTSSISTGAADGIGDVYSSDTSGTIIGAATSSIAQSSSSYYAYTETSGSNINNKWFWLRSPEVTITNPGSPNQVHLSIAYNAYTHPTLGMTDSAEEPLLRWWWI
tara:strand:+ start:244 stop:1107 length:864 start_codon:yes stop_codon:yes gene_type:complete